MDKNNNNLNKNHKKKVTDHLGNEYDSIEEMYSKWKVYTKEAWEKIQEKNSA